LPLTFKSNWLSYQKQAARNWRPSYRTYNSDLAQAYRLYTLALAGNADLASMNRLREFSEISNEAKWRLAAAYALAGQKEASEDISKSANINFKPQQYNYYTYGSADRNRAMALETMVLTKDSNRRNLAPEKGKHSTKTFNVIHKNRPNSMHDQGIKPFQNSFFSTRTLNTFDIFL